MSDHDLTPPTAALAPEPIVLSGETLASVKPLHGRLRGDLRQCIAALAMLGCASSVRLSDQRVIRKEIGIQQVAVPAVGGKGGSVAIVNEPAFILRSIEGKACLVDPTTYNQIALGSNYLCNWYEP